MKLSRSSAVQFLMIGFVLALMVGCAGRTPAAKWAEKRAALTSLNNTFSDAVDRGQLSDEQTVEIGSVLQMGTTYLDLAKEELPAGGSKFESLLLKAQHVLDLIEAQLATRKKEEVSNEHRRNSGPDRGREGTDRQPDFAVTAGAAERRHHRRATG